MNKSKNGLHGFRRQLPLHLMVLPAVVVTAIFAYIPMLGLVMAFQNFVPAKGFLGSEFVGLENFVRLFNTRGSGRIIWNTFFISFLKMVAGQLVPILLAILLNEIKVSPLKRTVQTILYLPYFLSWVICSCEIKK